MTIETTTHFYTGSIGWSGGKRHIIRVNEDTEGSFRGRSHPLCADAVRWNGTMQATMIKKEFPTEETITCKKCQSHLATLAVWEANIQSWEIKQREAVA